MANVVFKVGTMEQYNALSAKDASTLYWILDKQRVYKGDILFAVGANATAEMAGLLSPEDKAKLDSITSNGDKVDLEALDASVKISEGKIGVQVSAEDGNMIQVKSDGMYAALSWVEMN